MNYDGPSYYKNNDLEKKLDRKENDKELSEYIKENAKEIQSEKKEYLSSPPPTLNRNNKIFPTTNPGKDRFFRSKKIPESLQYLDGWKKTEWNQDLLVELEKRLSKKEEDYLLFAGEFEEKKIAKDQKLSLDQETGQKSQEKIEKVQKKIKENLAKPATGLHRSLSRIIAEDQEALKNGKNKLDSLFI